MSGCSRINSPQQQVAEKKQSVPFFNSFLSYFTRFLNGGKTMGKHNELVWMAASLFEFVPGCEKKIELLQLFSWFVYFNFKLIKVISRQNEY